MTAPSIPRDFVPDVSRGRPEITLAHEWIEETGGSEAVFRTLAGMFPTADLRCLWSCDDTVAGRRVHQSLLARTPLRRSKALSLPFMPLAWRLSRPSHADVVISSSHAFAHHLRGRRHTARTYAYVHTPARYLWHPELDERRIPRVARPIASVLRSMDRRSAASLHSIAANSHETAERILHDWGRTSTVIHPPVDTEFFSPEGSASSAAGSYILGVSRFIPYKRLSAVIETGELLGMPVVLAGSGPLLGDLQDRARRASVTVTVRDRPSRVELRDLYRGAACLVFPAHEDFGIVPVEAQACGIPVVARAVGGSLETVADGRTGILVGGTEPSDFAGAVERARGLRGAPNVSWARQFSTERFEEAILSWLRT